MPLSVEDWLHSLRLADYRHIFYANNYNTMDRVRNIWELELNSVSKVYIKLTVILNLVELHLNVIYVDTVYLFILSKYLSCKRDMNVPKFAVDKQ